MTKNRVHQGVPTGGQFAAQTHDEVDISLTGPVDGVSPASAPRTEPMSDEEADRIAFEPGNIEAWDSLDGPPGEIIEDPSTLAVGSFVYVKGHGKIRKAVVTKVGKKNAIARFTTPGACNEAAKFSQWATESYNDMESRAARAGAQAVEAHDYWVSTLAPNYPAYKGTSPAQLAIYIAQAESYLDKYPTREAAEQTAAAEERKRIERRYEILKGEGPIAFTTFTNATVKPGQAKAVPGH